MAIEMVAVISCPPLQVDYASLSTNIAVYQTEVNVSCALGHQLADNQYWNITRCRADKSWSPQLANCVGE